MANTAAKKQAVANVKALNQLHIVFGVVNALVLIGHFLLSRPRSLKAYILFSLPSFFLQFQLERLGRPKYDSRGSLVSAGEDLSQKGLIEWLHDVIYLTWGIDILLVLSGSNYVWYLILLIPGYASYAVYANFFKKTKSPFTEDAAQSEAKSKRQEKLEKRGQRIKYSR
ncbi:SRP-independent targeting protein 2 [Trichomonascus vanleenenianus]|uniref:Snd2p n=1 Tax=Trichomonascus vanleenenianus TaxID=2268995 RepID=UPI003ECB51A4